MSLAPQSSLNFTVEYESANVQNGARGSQVMLAYQQLQYTDANSLLSGSRLKQIDIVNQRGKKNIPLHIGFVGSNAILNDSDPGGSYQGTTSTLSFRLFNTLQKGTLRFNNQKNALSKSSRSKLTISFDSLDDERALATANELAGIDVETKGNWADITKKLQDKLPTIELTNFTMDELEAGASLDIKLKDIRSSKPSGFSNIYIRYEDIPGYWDGEFVLVVEKTPIIHRNVGKEKHVGIGVMPDAKYQLKVGGNLKVEADPDDQEMFIVGSKDGKQKYLVVDKDGQVGVGTNTPAAGISIKDGKGKENNPNDAMHITNDCILFGGKNNGKQTDSAQISAARHRANTLCIVGMSSGKDWKDRKIEMWAEGGTKINGALNVTGRIQDQSGYVMPPGTILPFAGPKSAIPKGFLPCDGKLVSKSKYTDLYNAISNSWGASGNNFRVPDLRGYFMRGAADGQATDPDRGSRYSKGGSKSKDNVGSYQDDSIKSHKHTGKANSAGDHKHSMHSYNGGGVNSKNHNNWIIYNDDGPKNAYKGKTSTTGKHTHTLSINNSGGKETRPKNVYVWYMIKY